MNRTQIEEAIQANNNRLKSIISSVNEENAELIKQWYLHSDENQWFVEQIEHHPRKKCQRKTHWLDGKLVGRIYWKDSFMDEDTGKSIEIERSQIVRVDGEWQVSLNSF